MKKKTIGQVMIAALLSAVALTACGSSDTPESRGRYEGDEGGGGKADTGDVELPEDEILLIRRYTNAAWSYADNGIFIDSNGDVYAFSFDKPFFDSYDGEGLSFMDSLELIRERTQPSGHMDEEFVKQVCALGEKIDPDAEMDIEFTACDAGQYSIYYYDAETEEMIKCASSGDNEEVSQDKNARELAELVRENLRENQDEEWTYVELYTAEDIPILNIHCGYMDALKGRFFLQTAEELSLFAGYTGLPVDDLLDSMEEYLQEESSYFVEITNVSSGGYDLKSCAIMNDGGTFCFIPSADNASPGEKDVVTDMMDGFCYAAAFPQVIDMDTAAANGWMSLYDAMDLYGWTELPGGGEVNPDLALYDDGAVAIMPEGSSHSPALAYPADDFVLDTVESTSECAYYYHEEHPELYYLVCAEMPEPDYDYFYYEYEPGPNYVFDYLGDTGLDVNGYDLCHASRYDPDSVGEETMYFFYFMYGSEDDPHTYTVAIPEMTYLEVAEDDEDLEEFLTEIFELEW